MILSLDRVNLTDDQFYRLCEANPTTPLERSASGALVIMSPVDGESGEREADLITDLALWNRQTKLGKVFSSSTLFKLPGGGDRSPDVAWVELSRWNTLTPDEQTGFPPICPDFVIELRSKTDTLPPLKDKMQEYLSSGLRLGWLINPQGQTVEIYRPTLSVETVPFPANLSGEAVFQGLH
ncbi:Uma2 family endonuclease [Nodosilinea sp. E11]|nr:Uma2 family endonuclease [Nodosilinea sp. E11]